MDGYFISSPLSAKKLFEKSAEKLFEKLFEKYAYSCPVGTFEHSPAIHRGGA